MKTAILLCIYFFSLVIGCENAGRNKLSNEKKSSFKKACQEVCSNYINDNINDSEYEKQISNSRVVELSKISCNKKNDLYHIPFKDTISFKRFWGNFQYNIRNNNREEIIKVLKMPVHSIHFVQFKYSYDCDTLKYAKNVDIYSDFDIDENNINEYYDFMFCETLKKMLLQTSTDRIFKEGIRYKNSSELIFLFFPKKYFKVNCPNDHNLKFVFSKCPKGWQIEIDGI